MEIVTYSHVRARRSLTAANDLSAAIATDPAIVLDTGTFRRPYFFIFIECCLRTILNATAGLLFRLGVERVDAE
jgi:hypothetical protein